MKKFVQSISFKVLNIVASLALIVTFVNVNSACFVFVHQPELPEGAKKLRKF